MNPITVCGIAGTVLSAGGVAAGALKEHFEEKKRQKEMEEMIQKAVDLKFDQMQNQD